MAQISFGDMATTYRNTSRQADFKATITRLTAELTTGVRQSTATLDTGDYGPISGIERGLRLSSALIVANTEAAQFAEFIQTGMDTLQTQATESASTLLIASNSSDRAALANAAQDAASRLDSAIAALNTRFADRAVFAGTASEGRAVVSATDMLDALELAVAGQTDADGVKAAVHSWFFDSGGGYETLAYLGSSTAPGAFRIGQSETAQVQVTAASDEVRQTLENLALATLVHRDVLSGDSVGQSALLRSAGEGLLSAEGALSLSRAAVGLVQSRIEESGVALASEKTALQQMRADLIGVDLYDVATELENTQSQLETLYSITARLSRLSLADFL